MKRVTLLALLFGLLNLAHGQKEFSYPLTFSDTTADTYFGDRISDPYRWMENPSDPRLLTWLEEQQNFTKKVSNGQTRKWELRAQLASMYHDVNRDKISSYRERNKKFTNKYDFEEKLTNFSKSSDLLFKLRDSQNYRLLIKAKDYQKQKGDKIDYTSKIVNEVNDLAVVTISVNGSDWNTGYTFDLKSGQRLPHVLQNLKGSNVCWFGNTLYFDAYNTPAKGRELLDKGMGQKLYKLEIGKDSLPQLLYTNPDTTGTNPFRYTIEDGKLFIYHFLKSRNTYYNAISCADLSSTPFFPRNFIVYPNEENIRLSVVHTSNDSVWLKTNWNAPNGMVLLANVNTPNKLSEFVPQYDMVLEQVNQLGKDKLALIYLHNGQNIALIYNHKGELLKKIDFPKGKRVRYFYEVDDVSHTHFSVTSFFHPDLLYQISLSDLQFTPVEALTVPYDVTNLETRYVSYPSNDGTEVAMYITCRKDVKLNGRNPVMIYGYGGYGSVVEPFFEQSIALFIAHGGILAVPNVRGGGAKGSNWAMAGRRLNKQNAINDFISAAEYLIKEKYTQPEKIVANGASHGGLLVTAAMIQRPELFKAVIAEAGPYDMLRFNHYTVGGVNTNLLEFGAPNNQDDYQNLRSYSPLHNIKENVKYPNLLLITGDSDDRVPPLHSYKFMASLQAKADKTGVYTLYVTKGAGHGGALTQTDFEDLLLFKYYFLFDNLKIDFY
jgi:prolyl oligopeptidase